MCSGEEMEDFMLLTRDKFISSMLRMHAANSSRKWRLLIKNAKMEKRGRTHRLPDKEIAKCVRLKPDVFREEMYSRSFDTLVDVIREAREELSTYRDILEISERI